MTGYKNEWDVYVRDTVEDRTVRVEGSNPRVESGFLTFALDSEVLSNGVSTALFPIQNVARVVRVKEDPEPEPGPFDS